MLQLEISSIRLKNTLANKYLVGIDGFTRPLCERSKISAHSKRYWRAKQFLLRSPFLYVILDQGY